MIFILLAILSFGMPRGNPIGIPPTKYVDCPIATIDSVYIGQSSSGISPIVTNYPDKARAWIGSNGISIFRPVLYYHDYTNNPTFTFLSNTVVCKYATVTNGIIYANYQADTVISKNAILTQDGYNRTVVQYYANFQIYTNAGVFFATNYYYTNTACLEYSAFTNILRKPFLSNNNPTYMWLTYDFSKMDNYWSITSPSQLPADTYPVLVWNTNNPIVNCIGLSALSHASTWAAKGGLANGNFSWASNPVKLITKRHGVINWHSINAAGSGLDYNTNSSTYGYMLNWPGHRVYFCTTNNTIVEARVQSAYSAYYSPQKQQASPENFGQIDSDFCILLFSNDVPSINPIELADLKNIISHKLAARPDYANVAYTTPLVNFIYNGYVDFNLNYFGANYQHQSFIPGNSGQPACLMVQEGSTNKLILIGQFAGAPVTNGIWQAVVDKVSIDAGLNTNSYQLNWWSGYTNYPSLQ